MSDFLLELLSEEIPARMQEKACGDLVRLFEAELAKSGLKAEAIERFVTPRRLALIAKGLPAATQAVSEELKGPRADAPEQALAGFLGKTGLTRDQLVEREDAKGNTILFAVIEKPGRPTAAVLAEAVPAIVRAFPWPKSMRWGDASLSTESLRWVRPLQGIVALFGDEVVPFAIADVASGATTVGHRFHHPDVVTIGSAADYACKLRACHVIVDSEERRRIVREGAEAAAAAEGLVLVPDEGLVAENAGLTEWPVPLLGRFDPAFLTVPREVIQLTMRTNQKYFTCNDAAGTLAPAFVCTANIVASDGGAKIVEGNAKVLAARLSDARFFWEQDLKIPLVDQAKKLDQIVFHEKLGTVADKVERVAKLARWLVEEGIVKGANPDEAEQAARLAKADLVTGMVGEFPELQGVMGGYYARAEGLPDAVADAIRDHYKPVGQGDEVPTAPVTVAVSLADKLDSIVGFFGVDEKPTGSKDPYALRRSALGVLSVQSVIGSRFRLSVIVEMLRRIYHRQEFERALADDPIASVVNVTRPIREFTLSHTLDGERLIVDGNTFGPFTRGTLDRLSDRIHIWGSPLSSLETDVVSFFADRLKVQQREAGVRHDLIDAVFALGGEDDLVRLLARVKALQAFVETEEGANLLAGYRRAANILRAEAKKGTEIGTFTGFIGYDPDAAEAKLAKTLDVQLPVAEQAMANERFGEAMTALSHLRPAIDAFFDDVTVNSDEPAKRSARLALLEKLRAAMHNIADFSKIEG
ncbi:glycine--tRNA ligase subunit beta [Nostoc sp. 3335mG]|nr:glycine--tRNA ligase subunit beta [Nostoc sp. 3335mG]